MGYVAVATDEGVAALGRRDIVVAWRGTLKSLEWVNDFDFTPVSAAPVLGSAAAVNPAALVHRGFLSVYTSSNPNSQYNQSSARDQVSNTTSARSHFISQFLTTILPEDRRNSKLRARLEVKCLLQIKSLKNLC